MASSSAVPHPRTRIPLVAILAVVAFCELVLNRVIARLIHLEFLQPRSTLTHALDGAGLFFFELVGVLAVLLLAVALARIALFARELRPGARISLPLVGGVFLVLASLGIVVRLPPSLMFHLHLSFFFFGLLLLLATLAAPTTWSVRLGMLFLVVAVGIRLVPLIANRFGFAPDLTPARFEWLSDGQLVAIALAALCFVPRHGNTRLAPILTWSAVCIGAFLIRRDFDTAQRVAAYGFGIDLPLNPIGQLLCLSALAATVYASVRLLSQPGIRRLRGYGLVLLALGGAGFEQPGLLAVTALGLLCIGTSAARVDGTPLSREAFDRLMRAGAAALGTPQVTLTGAPGYEIARLHAPPEAGTAVEVVVARRAGVISDVEITVGEAPPREPPFSIARSGTQHLGPHAAGARVGTEDVAFDRAFEVYDKRGGGAALLDEPTRARMTEHLAGWLGLWPQRGLRYRATTLPPTDDALVPLLTLLRDLYARTA
ncbi:MAG TPA: hypothetical protein VII38_08590 [Polyangia bacterium]